MKNERCKEFMNDPERWSTHLEECDACRAEFEAFERGEDALPGTTIIDTDGMPVERITGSLPVAPWEGAGHRPWALVVVGAGLILIVAAALFAFAGISPLTGFATAFRSSALPLPEIFRIASSIAELVRSAPGAVQVGLLVAFVVVNALLFALLRRAPRGADATNR
ncbi:MAG: hypothetical protein WBX15_05690 [Thermoanaerobaculia bacterium]